MRPGLSTAFGLFGVLLPLLGQEGGQPAKKVRVYITESGAMQLNGAAAFAAQGSSTNQNSSADQANKGTLALQGPTSSENIEVMKAFGKHCPSVVVTSNREKADFVIRLDREGPSPATPFIKGNKVAVFNKIEDLIYTESSRTLAPVVKGACGAVTEWAKATQ